MKLQISLMNEPVKPWSDSCAESCWTATKKRCVCRCGGRYHGYANSHLHTTNDKHVERVLGGMEVWKVKR